MITLGLHPGDAVRCDRILDLGARHPSSHGMFRLQVELNGSTIIKATPLIGAMHRGAEKLFEARDYRQLVMLTDRHDWLSAPGSELGAVLAIEHLLGLEPPIRAQWLRTMLAEFNRMSVHSLFLAEFPWAAVSAHPTGTKDPDTHHQYTHDQHTHDTGDNSLESINTRLRELRETTLQLTEQLTGARIHVMWNQIGGVRSDIPDHTWIDHTRRIADEIAETTAGLTDLIRHADNLDNGQLTAEQVEQFGVSGVIARASGVDRDLRRDIPYLAYPHLAHLLHSGEAQQHNSNMKQEETTAKRERTAGTSRARMLTLLHEIQQSRVLVDACLTELSGLQGPIDSPLPKVLRVPEGSAYRATENPLGTNGYWLVSDADKMPLRMKLRSASFNNISALESMLTGAELSDVLPTLATTFFVTGDIDK